MTTSSPTRGFPRPFGTYLLLGSLGRGGMGEVFLARRGHVRGAERLCVLKTTRSDVNAPGAFGKGGDEYANRFLDEAKLAVALAHANICHVFDVGRVDSDLYIAMEHIAGITVRALLDALAHANRSLPPSHAIYVVTELLDALDYAHRRVHPVTQQPLAIVHRDVSPQNVMVTFEGEVKLIDFGLALSRMKEEETSAQVVMGKLSYMSPEQMRGELVDARTDQFAAAIVLYEMLTGQRYYGSLDRAAVVAAAMTGAYRPAGFRDVDSDIAAVLGRALAHSKEDRYATCDDFASALRGVMARRQMAVSRTSLRDLIRALLPTSISDHEALVAALAAAAGDEFEMPTTLELPRPAVDDTAIVAMPPPAVADTETHPSTPARSRLPLAALTAFVAVAVLGFVVVSGDGDDDSTSSSSSAATDSVVQSAPVQDAPVQAAPVEDAPVQNAPVQDAPVQDAPVQDAPVQDAPVEHVEPVELVEPVVRDALQKKKTKPSRSTTPRSLPPLAKMWPALERCSHSCAQGLVLSRAKGSEPPAWLVEQCYVKCVKR